MSLAKPGIPRFHVALSGECFVGAAGHDGVKVGETEIVMLPKGDSHWIADRPGRELIPSDRAGKACELGYPLFQQGDKTNRLMCGMVHFDVGAAHPILDALPDMMRFPMLEPTGPVWSVVSLIDAEMAKHRDKPSFIADRLTEVLFLQLLNHYVSNSDATTGFLAALRDKRVYHEQPEFDWSLSSLGARVGMSRATLVRRFQDIVGVAPMAYIMDWRIMKTHELLKHTTLPLEQVAHSTGFASARTLTRTFKRRYGCTPTELRRSQHEA